MTSGTDPEVKHAGSHVLIDKIELKGLKQKARTYDEIEKIIPEMYKDWKSILPQINQNQKLLGLVKDELQGWEVEWKDFKPECGTAALDQHGANMVMAVLKSLLEGSKK